MSELKSNFNILGKSRIEKDKNCDLFIIIFINRKK